MTGLEIDAAADDATMGGVGASDVRERRDDGLSALFLKQDSVRLSVLKQFAASVQDRLADKSTVADRAGEILRDLAVHLPIRTLDALRSEFGEETEFAARSVIDEAAKLAGWVWTGAAVFPGLPHVVTAVKVIVHSAVEIRMIGELRALYETAGQAHDQAWLNAVLATWTSGRPMAAGGSAGRSVHDVAVKIQRGLHDFAAGRITNLINRGREGSDAVRREGARHHRRMLVDPSAWGQPAALSTTDLVRSVGDGARSRIRIPRRPGARVAAEPKAILEEAWHHHLRARAAANAGSDGNRLHTALDAQERHLRQLGAPPKAGLTPSIPTDLADPSLASQYFLAAEDVIDRIEAAA